MQLPCGNCEPRKLLDTFEALLKGSPLVVETVRFDPPVAFGQPRQLQATKIFKEPGHIAHEAEWLHFSLMIPLCVVDIHMVQHGVDMPQQFPIWQLPVLLMGHLFRVGVHLVLPATVLGLLRTRASSCCSQSLGRGLLLIWRGYPLPGAGGGGTAAAPTRGTSTGNASEGRAAPKRASP